VYCKPLPLLLPFFRADRNVFYFSIMTVAGSQSASLMNHLYVIEYIKIKYYEISMLHCRQKMAVTSKWRLFDSKLMDEVRNTGLKEFSNTKVKENACIAVALEMGSTGM